VTARYLSSAAAGVGRGTSSRSVLVEKTDTASWNVAVIAEVQTDVTSSMDVAAETYRILQPSTKRLKIKPIEARLYY